MDYTGKVVIVTGASSGIGYDAALAFACRGAVVVAVARREGHLRRLVGELRPHSPDSSYLCGDLGIREFAKRVVGETVQRHGRLDVLVNNAGAIRGGDFLGTPAEQWAEDWRLKLLGYTRMAQAVLPRMRARRWGRIINIIGAAARNPTPDYMAGGIANAGLINFTRALADLGALDQILVTAVSPGATATERWDGLVAQRARAQGRPAEDLRRELEAKQPLGRIGRPADVADLVVFLASERASFITGVSITVDGGASRGVYL